jgi:nicotinate-nucleotide--dimethylbenzimidazole phosphoribosyltransferase
VSEDAAAAARRIVAEVLERHGQARAPVESSAPAEHDSAGSAASPSPRAEPSRGSGLVAASDDAAAIARRIVDEVLAQAVAMDPAASPTVEVAREAQRLVDEPDEPAVPSPVEAHVEHVPADGLSAGDETATVEVEVVADVPEADATSAADIVRRIVAEVTAAAPTSPPEDAPSAPPETTPASEDAATSEAPEEPTDRDAREEEPPPAPPASRREPTRELDPSAADPDATAPAPSGAPGPDDRAATAGPTESEPTQQVPVRRPDPEPEVTREVPQAATGVSLLETEGATDVVDEPVPGASVPAADEPGFEAVVYAPVSPSEDEAPGPPGPDPSADEKEPKPHTLRWLLTSILGAIALAVLLPLAVGALRSLVALG